MAELIIAEPSIHCLAGKETESFPKIRLKIFNSFRKGIYPMLSKKSKPLIERLAGRWISGKRAKQTDAATTTSPRSPLDFISQPSPRGLKNYDLGGVGLGIVAALEKSTQKHRSEIQAKTVLYGRSLSRSDPIPVNSTKITSARLGRGTKETNMDGLEVDDLTYVTFHGANQSSNARSRPICVFDISPARFSDSAAYPNSDFLRSCHLCQKKLHGRDIYMYRGEKAFCSAECRYKQIVMDERREQGTCKASRSADVSSSPYTNTRKFSTGILVI